MCAGMSGYRRSLAYSSTEPGNSRSGASPRRMLCVVAMTSAAGIPLSVTSPVTIAIWPLGNSIVEITADRARRLVVGCDAPSRQGRQLAGEQLLLDHPRGVELLRLPLAVFLRVPQPLGSLGH